MEQLPVQLRHGGFTGISARRDGSPGAPAPSAGLPAEAARDAARAGLGRHL